MNQKLGGRTSSSEQIIRDIKRNTRKQYSAEEKIRIVLGGLRGEDSIVKWFTKSGHRIKAVNCQNEGNDGNRKKNTKQLHGRFQSGIIRDHLIVVLGRAAKS